MTVLVDGPRRARAVLVLAHGAGAPMDSPFMAAIARGLAERGIRVVRFEFPYMAARRAGGPRRPPDPMRALLEAWRAAVAEAGGSAFVIGGKSLGGRAASLIADEIGARGLVCLGFPFHAPGKPPGSRIEHLATLRAPALIVQGTRDPMGTPSDVAGYALSPAIRVHWIEGGDHSLELPRTSGRPRNAGWADAVEVAAGFILGLG